MKIYSQLKTFTLLCALPISSAFASRPTPLSDDAKNILNSMMAGSSSSSSASQQPAVSTLQQPAVVIPASLQKELKRIEDLPDHKMLTMVLPHSIDSAEQHLRKVEDRFKGSHHSLASAQAQIYRSGLKYWAIKDELTSCPDGALKQTLQIELDEACNQYNAHLQEEQICAPYIVRRWPFEAYTFMAHRYNALAAKTSILLAQKETEKAQWLAQQQIKESQWQQREQSLLAELARFQLPEDGPQEGPIFHEESE